MTNVQARRILVVEDEALIASMIVDWLEEMGCEAVGPAFQLSDGFKLAEKEPLDAAVLDVNVRSERIDPLAEYLRNRGVPVVFASGYGETIGQVRGGATALEKPFTYDQLARALTSALHDAKGA
jgi:DNA-binding response OmpR family regulator